MGFIRTDAALQVLLVTKGHPFERDAFFAVFESWPDIACGDGPTAYANAGFRRLVENANRWVSRSEDDSASQADECRMRRRAILPTTGAGTARSWQSEMADMR